MGRYNFLIAALFFTAPVARQIDARQSLNRLKRVWLMIILLGGGMDSATKKMKEQNQILCILFLGTKNITPKLIFCEECGEGIAIGESRTVD